MCQNSVKDRSTICQTSVNIMSSIFRTAVTNKQRQAYGDNMSNICQQYINNVATPYYIYTYVTTSMNGLHVSEARGNSGARRIVGRAHGVSGAGSSIMFNLPQAGNFRMFKLSGTINFSRCRMVLLRVSAVLQPATWVIARDDFSHLGEFSPARIS